MNLQLSATCFDIYRHLQAEFRRVCVYIYIYIYHTRGDLSYNKKL